MKLQPSPTPLILPTRQPPTYTLIKTILKLIDYTSRRSEQLGEKRAGSVHGFGFHPPAVYNLQAMKDRSVQIVVSMGVANKAPPRKKNHND